VPAQAKACGYIFSNEFIFRRSGMPTKTNHSPDSLPANQAIIKTPLGFMYLEFSAKGLKKLRFMGEEAHSQSAAMESTRETKPLPEGVPQKWRDQVAQAVADYLAGKPGAFEGLSLDLQGSPFHLRVWQELRKIPSGETVSYQELARRVGNPKASRAVGQACGANPIPLIVPCHRVISSNGSLGGFSSSLERKRLLLGHEQVNVKE
jgi:O-6-methylguanine DNA methyltransferase